MLKSSQRLFKISESLLLACRADMSRDSHHKSALVFQYRALFFLCFPKSSHYQRIVSKNYLFDRCAFNVVLVASVSMKLFQVYKDGIKPGAPPISDAPTVSFSSTSFAYELALVAHLPGELNGGNHHAYVDVLGDDGQPLINPPLRIGYTWEGRRNDEDAPPVELDKGPNDPAAGNIPIGKGMNMVLWLQDAGPLIVSDIVSGLQTATPDTDPATGNSRFHHSFYIVFRKRRTVVQPPTPQPVTLETLAADVAALKRRIAVLEAR